MARAKPEAQFNRHARGESMAKDLAEAVRLYRLAAEQKHVGAQFSLGV